MPSQNLPLTAKFDFRYYLPDQPLGASNIQLNASDCSAKSFAAVLLAENLIPAHIYRVEYFLVSPQTNETVFNPQVATLYASYTTQNFVTSVILPNSQAIGSSYVLQANITDITEGAGASALAQVNITCGPSKKAFYVELLDPDSVSDDTFDIGDCNNDLPLVGVIRDAFVGSEYHYEFYDNPVGGIIFEKKSGDVFAGDTNQNFNSKIALTGYPYVFVHAKVTDKETGLTRISDPLLLKCFQTDPCDVVLPTGVNCDVGVQALTRCAYRGLTNQSISSLYGGQGFSIGDKLTTVGGGGYGAEIEIIYGGITAKTFTSLKGGSCFAINDLIEVTGGGGSGGMIKITSGGLSNDSIASLNGCSGFSVGDYLTTIGGGGRDVVIRVESTGVNGNINSFNVINPGYGFTNIPHSLLTLKGSGQCASATFINNKFTIPCAGAVSSASLSLEGGTGYNIGEKLNIVGGGGTDAQLEILSGSLTESSITLSGGSGYNPGDYLTTVGGEGSDVVIVVNTVGSGGSISGWSLLNSGYGFTSAPTSIVKLTGSGAGASFAGNDDNFAITPKGGITKASISDMDQIGLNYSVGSQLFSASSGGGNGAVIEVISINNYGAISDFIIKNPGHSYVSAPILIDSDGVVIENQPVWDNSKFTKYSYVIINGGCNYSGAPSAINSADGNGHDAIYTINSSSFTAFPYTIVNTGTKYTSAPTGLVVRTGTCSASGVVAVFNSNNFTIPCSGGITYESVSGLIGKSSFIVGEELVVDGGDGLGGKIKITGVNNGAVTSFVILNSGCGYTTEPVLKKFGGTIVAGVSFDTSKFTPIAFTVTNPGFGYVEVPTDLTVLTGNGDVTDIFVSFNDNNFIDIVGPPPTPSNTVTPSVTPTATPFILPDNLQTAGEQNAIYPTVVAVEALIGQNVIIVEDTQGLEIYSVLDVPGLPIGTHITKVEPWFANFDNRVIYKRLTLSNNTTGNIPANTPVNVVKVDIRLIRVPSWAGITTFSYNAYSILDRFKVYAVPVDSRRPDILMFDSGYVGDTACGYADTIAGPGDGSVNLYKPDSCFNIKVIVEAPCDGTAWNYVVSPLQRPSPTPTKTPTTTPTPTKLN